MNCFRFLRCVVWLGTFTSSLAVGQTCVSQDDGVLASNKRTVLDAVRSIDSNQERDLNWITAFLEQRVVEVKNDSLAYCTLGIAQFRVGEFERAKASFEKASIGETAAQVRPTSGKFQLLCAINADDAVRSNQLFQALLDACQRETTSLSLRKSYCEWLGEIIGTLNSDEAKSPIQREALERAKKQLLGLAEVQLSEAFEGQYANAQKRSERLRDALSKLDELGPEDFADLEKTLSGELEKLEQILVASVKESRELNDETEEAARGLRQEIANLRQQIRQIEIDWANATMGMPAPVFAPPGPPLPPRLDLIFVDPVRIRIITEFRNGQIFERQIQERRDFRDMEIERDLIYQTQLATYNTQLVIYNNMLSLFSQYQKNLAEWKKRDTERRNQLTDKRRGLEAEIAQIKLKLDALDGGKKGGPGGNSDLKKGVAQLKLELESVQAVARAGKIGMPHTALRPYQIDPWLLTEERNRLLKLFTGR